LFLISISVNVNATSSAFPLSLHDALPILHSLHICFAWRTNRYCPVLDTRASPAPLAGIRWDFQSLDLCTSLCWTDGYRAFRRRRSEEHTLNSSHVSISYAVFCLKKKNQSL